RPRICPASSNPSSPPSPPTKVPDSGSTMPACSSNVTRALSPWTRRKAWAAPSSSGCPRPISPSRTPAPARPPAPRPVPMPRRRLRRVPPAPAFDPHATPSVMPIDIPDNALHPILVVDDEEVVLVSLRDLLRREGYQVTTAPNAIEALAHLKAQPYSVVITDHQMPMLTGLEFLAQVKQMQPDATRILITAVLNLATVIDAINKGEIYRFIVKPWLREELIVTVKNAVQRYELISRNQMLQVTTLAMNERLVKLNHELEEQVAHVEDQNAELERLNL